MSIQRTLFAASAQTGYFRQLENAAATYTVDWGGLEASAPSASTWSSPDGATLAGAALTTTKATVRVSGSVGRRTVVNQVTMASGDTQERVLCIDILDNDTIQAGNRSTDYCG